jgi:hypothetical protein
MGRQAAASKNIIQTFLALQDFANLGDAAEALDRFLRKWPNFVPFWLEKSQAGGRALESPMEPSFLPVILAWRDLLRHVWRGKAERWELETLLGMNPDALGPWEGTAPSVSMWNQGLEAIRAAGLQLAKLPPRIRARWEAGGLDYEHGTWFERGVFTLWKDRWRARVCPMCDSYFVARQKAQKFCSSFCVREGKNASNRRWWRESGPDWRKHYLTKKAKEEEREQAKRREKR